jgi:hypothetical protein
LVGRKFCECLSIAVGPADLDIGCFRLANAKVQAAVIAGKVTRLAGDFLNLLLAPVPDQHTGADRAPIRRRSDQLQLEPPIISANVVAQKRGRLI